MTGRRRRRLRRVAYVFGSASLVYTGLVGAGFSAGPIDPQALLPLPDLLDRPEETTSTRAPAGPAARPQSAAAAPTDTSAVLDQAIPAPTGPPPQAAALAVLAEFGPAAGRPLENHTVSPAPTETPSPLSATEQTSPAEPSDPAGAEDGVPPAEPHAATPEPEPPASTTEPAASTDASPAAASGTPESGQSLAREGRRPSPRPVAPGQSR